MRVLRSPDADWLVNPTCRLPPYSTVHTLPLHHTNCLGLDCPLANNFSGLRTSDPNASKAQNHHHPLPVLDATHRKSDNTTTVAMPTRTSKTRKQYVLNNSPRNHNGDFESIENGGCIVTSNTCGCLPDVLVASRENGIITMDRKTLTSRLFFVQSRPRLSRTRSCWQAP